MEQHEKEIMDRIRQHIENIEIPEQLRPEVVEEQLMRHQKRYRKKAYRYALTAAACLGLLGIAYIQTKERTVGKKGYVNPVVKEVKESEGLRMAKSYKEVYKFVEEFDYYYGDGVVLESEEKAASENAVEDSGKTESSYSKTNTREESVDEGDIVKTDGRYLYVVKEEGNEIGIVDTAENKLEQIEQITLGEEMKVSEIYVQNQYLIVLGSERERIYNNKNEFSKIASDCAEIDNSEAKSIIYDISDREKPKKLGECSQSGSYVTSRLNNHYLYVFSQYNIYNPEEGKKEQYIPCVDGELLASDEICLPETERANTYTVITAIDIQNPSAEKNSVSILSNGGFCYASAKNIYICENIWKETGRSTEIRKFSYGNGKINGQAKAEVNGYLNDSFSVDEYNGYLRMVTTLEETESNSVYVLDEKLNVTGTIENLAKNERIYSARFMGDTGYFVTFRETDPLFSVDLSDPDNPKIIGTLKIPGFSEYLHPYGDGLLLGIGEEVDEKGVESNQVKLSMFDISDPSNVKEIDKIVLNGSYYSTAFDQYKSVLADAEKNLIVFYTFGEKENYYHIYEYNRMQGFTCKRKEMTKEYGENVRGIYIGSTFYLINGNQIESYNLENYEKIEELIL